MQAAGDNAPRRILPRRVEQLREGAAVRGEIIGVLKSRADHGRGGTSIGIEQLRTLPVDTSPAAVSPRPTTLAFVGGLVAGAYVNSILAKREVVAMGYDEALMLDTEGYVSEASGENIFMMSNGVLKTTPLTSVLRGITRDCVLTFARDLGVPVVEERFTRCGRGRARATALGTP